MGCGLLINFKFSKKFIFFLPECTTRTRCVCSHRPDCEEGCEEDSDEATGAESSSDEGEDAGPGEVHSEPHPPLPNKNPV